MQQHYHIFTDGSLNPLTKEGIGACLITASLIKPLNELATFIKTKHFANTSSTQLELQTLVWGFELLKQQQGGTNNPLRISFYTDSNNIVTLPQRRNAIEQRNYCSKNSSAQQESRLLNNHDLYRQFFQLLGECDAHFVKIAGHQPSKDKQLIDQIFTLVDKAARKALRENNKLAKRNNAQTKMQP